MSTRSDFVALMLSCKPCSTLLQLVMWLLAIVALAKPSTIRVPWRTMEVLTASLIAPLLKRTIWQRWAFLTLSNIDEFTLIIIIRYSQLHFFFFLITSACLVNQLSNTFVRLPHVGVLQSQYWVFSESFYRLVLLHASHQSTNGIRVEAVYIWIASRGDLWYILFEASLLMMIPLPLQTLTSWIAFWRNMRLLAYEPSKQPDP